MLKATDHLAGQRIGNHIQAQVAQSQAALERITQQLTERRMQLAMSRSEHEERTRDLRAREQELAAAKLTGGDLLIRLGKL